MTEQAKSCPVRHDGPSRYTLVLEAAQRHITEPGNHRQINRDVTSDLNDHYALMYRTRPHVARQKVTRGVRAAAMTAFFHIAATPASVSQTTHGGSMVATDYPPRSFRHTEFKTLPALQCAERISEGFLRRWQKTQRGMLDVSGPLTAYRGLARCLPALNGAFDQAIIAADPGYKFASSYPHTLVSASQDNASALLDVLIDAGVACSMTGASSQQALTRFVLDNATVLGQRASVNRPTSAVMSGYHEPAAPGYSSGRKALTVAYETALLHGEPISSRRTGLVTEPDLAWTVPSLQTGPWREPGHCAGYPELSSYLDPNTRFRTIEVELTKAALVAADTIYAHWPGHSTIDPAISL